MSKLNDFIKRADKVHDRKYDYSKVVYTNSKTKVIIICKKHGEFEQTPNSHIQKRGCPSCGDVKSNNNKRVGISKFIERAIRVHFNKYDYTKSEYINYHTDIIVTCKLHGDFKLSPAKHLKGGSCIKCMKTYSKKEKEVVKFIKSLKIYKFETSNRSILNGKELDIYIPELNKAIEFNGIYWHYHKNHFVPGKHGKKSKLCKEKGIRLLHVREDLWDKNTEEMKNIIIKFLKYNG